MEVEKILIIQVIYNSTNFCLILSQVLFPKYITVWDNVTITILSIRNIVYMYEH